MATINYLGLTGVLRSVTADPAVTTFAGLISLFAADEGLDSAYYITCFLRDGNINSITGGAQTLNQLGWVTGDIILCTPNQVGTLEYRQVQKLEIAQVKRRAWGNTTAQYYRTLNTYDRNLLPAKYIGNTSVPNVHPSGLIEGRPWLAGGPVEPGYILQEDGFYILQEDGSRIFTEV